ncbi:electron transfer flavoprotein subunit beta/FixA family protein [Microaerobacter geothermalis]|uniref:electron transfer flavoprotein subunit beta/FixA family protein n=1 Tax=Microaerobacter geothermalis TaxID=674972 RepID=UPI001F2FF26E|nr:electron transfer flavoprotein subunit beta/FixA family protein [Microaerobacter geothermalis]MCF6094861.1 electron transfer flavoprotein subunit beta/FixA family protein [Microaerobacter geothermalis]
MKILVCLKQTFDTEERIVIQDGQISEEGVEFIINPYDEYAVEEALKLREQHGGEVTVITVGPTRAESALRTALAMGADKAVIVHDESLFGDEYTIAKVLAAVVKQREYDIILAGNMAVDDGSAQVGPRLAEELGIPHVSTIVKLDVEGNKARVERDVEGDTEVIEVQLPVLVTAQQGLNEPRYPSLPGIMKAKKKPLERLSAGDLGLDPSAINSKTELVDQYLPPKKEAGKILQGEIGDQVKELVQLLRNEAKVI